METPSRTFHTTPWMAGVLVLCCTLVSPAMAGPKGAETIDVHQELKRAYKLIEYNGITRAAVHLERVVAHDPTGHPDAYFSLAQIYEHKGMMQRSALLYRAYIAQGRQEALLGQAKEALGRVEGATWTPVKVVIKGVDARVWVDGYVVGEGVKEVVVKLPAEAAQRHSIKVESEHYDTETHDITVGGEPVTVSVVPVKKVYFGGIQVVVDQAGAKVSIAQEQADSVRAPAFEYEDYGSMKAEAVVAAGVYFITVTHPEFETWVRRVEVGAYGIQGVRAHLTRAKPPELRMGDEEENLSALRHN